MTTAHPRDEDRVIQLPATAKRRKATRAAREAVEAAETPQDRLRAARAEALAVERWQAEQAAADATVRAQIIATMPAPLGLNDQRKMAEVMAGMPLPVLLLELGMRAEAAGKRLEAIRAVDAAAAYLYPTLKAVEMRVEGSGPMVPHVAITMPPPAADEAEQLEQHAPARPFG